MLIVWPRKIEFTTIDELWLLRRAESFSLLGKIFDHLNKEEEERGIHTYSRSASGLILDLYTTTTTSRHAESTHISAYFFVVCAYAHLSTFERSKERFGYGTPFVCVHCRSMENLSDLVCEDLEFLFVAWIVNGMD